ncbi:DUF4260 domain-containing protein [Marinomonas sp. 5E14-1]|uniref:DUF4260 domain-containing protein n=1 Tax=Marinomonas sp. 5E14-1 TaxID=3153922 RepID=UPI003262F366
MMISRNLKGMLRLEAVAILILSSITYFQYNPDWRLFALLFLLPDLAILGYLASNKTGAILYNITHSLIGPAVCFGISWLVLKSELGISIGLIWLAHVGFDRTLGYGLKYAIGFKHTHLGIIGK